jgi:hypothetical protein
MGCKKCHAKPNCAGIHKKNMLFGQCHGPAHALRSVSRPGQL